MLNHETGQMDWAALPTIRYTSTLIIYSIQ